MLDGKNYEPYFLRKKKKKKRVLGIFPIQDKIGESVKKQKRGKEGQNAKRSTVARTK